MPPLLSLALDPEKFADNKRSNYQKRAYLFESAVYRKIHPVFQGPATPV
jgi:hypothetical protein